MPRPLHSFCGVERLVARRAHNPKVAGSNPAPATNPHSPALHKRRSAALFNGRFHTDVLHFSRKIQPGGYRLPAAQPRTPHITGIALEELSLELARLDLSAGKLGERVVELLSG